MTLVIQLDHPSDPRFLLVEELPERVTFSDLETWRYGKLLLFAPEEPTAIYAQPEGFGTDYVVQAAELRD